MRKNTALLLIFVVLFSVASSTIQDAQKWNTIRSMLTPSQREIVDNISGIYQRKDELSSEHIALLDAILTFDQSVYEELIQRLNTNSNAEAEISRLSKLISQGETLAPKTPAPKKDGGLSGLGPLVSSLLAQLLNLLAGTPASGSAHKPLVDDLVEDETAALHALTGSKWTQEQDNEVIFSQALERLISVLSGDQLYGEKTGHHNKIVQDIYESLAQTPKKPESDGSRKGLLEQLVDLLIKLLNPVATAVGGGTAPDVPAKGKPPGGAKPDADAAAAGKTDAAAAAANPPATTSKNQLLLRNIDVVSRLIQSIEGSENNQGGLVGMISGIMDIGNIPFNEQNARGVSKFVQSINNSDALLDQLLVVLYKLLDKLLTGLAPSKPNENNKDLSKKFTKAESEKIADLYNSSPEFRKMFNDNAETNVDSIKALVSGLLGHNEENSPVSKRVVSEEDESLTESESLRNKLNYVFRVQEDIVNAMQTLQKMESASVTGDFGSSSGDYFGTGKK
eukprot:gene3896-4507_t